MDTPDVWNPRQRAARRRARLAIVLASALLLTVPRPASADIIKLTNGRTMSVDSCRFDGESVIIVFHGGGEVRASKDIIAEILTDEVPQAMAFALEALAASASASGPRLSDLAIR